MDWSQDDIARLRELWATDLSTAEIGRRMGITKSAVVGKAHRLDLPRRPSPIRPGAGTKPRAPGRLRGPASLPPVASLAQPVVAPMGAPSAPPAPLPAPLARPVAQRPVVSVAKRPLKACCWPIGELGTPEFHFCDADAESGKPYCELHCQRAYVRPRDRREDDHDSGAAPVIGGQLSAATRHFLGG